MTSPDDRIRFFKLIQEGKITPDEGIILLDKLCDNLFTGFEEKNQDLIPARRWLCKMVSSAHYRHKHR